MSSLERDLAGKRQETTCGCVGNLKEARKRACGAQGFATQQAGKGGRCNGRTGVWSTIASKSQLLGLVVQAPVPVALKTGTMMYCDDTSVVYETGSPPITASVNYTVGIPWKRS
eukprot:2218916-Rhodomonas_salina.1